MRIIYSEEVRKLSKEVDPYLVFVNTDIGFVFKENTPKEIKQKYELWKKLVADEDKKAKEIFEYE